jgi:hypothetical protein
VELPQEVLDGHVLLVDRLQDDLESTFLKTVFLRH